MLIYDEGRFQGVVVPDPAGLGPIWEPVGRLGPEAAGPSTAVQRPGLDRSERRCRGMTVVKVLELVGESKHSWQEAAENAVAEAAKTVHNITGVEIYNLTANVDGSNIVEYKANVKVAFAVDERR